MFQNLTDFGDMKRYFFQKFQFLGGGVGSFSRISSWYLV